MTNEKTYARVLFHDVEYWYNDMPGKELSDIDREHIVYNIVNGNSSGEIFREVDTTEQDETGGEYVSGWWQLKGHESQ